MKLKVKFDGSREWNSIGSWTYTNPYSIIFVYPKDGETYVLKGGLKRVEEKLKEDNRPLGYIRTMYHKGRARGGNHMAFLNLGEIKAYIMRPKDKFQFIIFREGLAIFDKELKRIPRCFPHQISTAMSLVKQLKN